PPQGLADPPTQVVNGCEDIRASFEAVGLPRLTPRGGTRMELHRNAKLGLSGRFALVQARASGMTVREAARRFSVSPATVSRWSCRWRAASEEERCSLGCLFDRSSRPKRMPRLLPAGEPRRSCAA